MPATNCHRHIVGKRSELREMPSMLTWNKSEGGKNWEQLFTATQLAAARVQENEKAATLAMSMEGAAGQDIADAIRALIGSKP